MPNAIAMTAELDPNIAQTLSDFGLSQTAVSFLPGRVAAEPEKAASLRAAGWPEGQG